MFVTFLRIAHFQPLSVVTGIFITSDNVREYATFFHSSGSIVNHGRLIHFNSGLFGQELLRIPIGEIKPHSTIRITVALKPRGSTVDSDPYFGISDGVNSNLFILRDPSNFGSSTPCEPFNALQDDVRIPARSAQASVYQLQFDLFHQYGTCSAAYSNGYSNTGRFNAKLDVAKKLYLVVKREHGNEQYDFRYFNIEVF